MKKVLFWAVAGMVVTLILAGCAPKKVESPPVVSPVAEGKALYSANCAACHGPEAEGTTLGPALPGHGADIIRRQVRAPMGQMPVFSESQLSDAQLKDIIAYIASLPTPEEHVEPLEMDDAVIVHHWMVIFALKSDDAKDAAHHLDHIIQMVTDQAHKEQGEEAKALIAAGKLHDAEHEVEEMLAGKASPKMGVSQLHLQLAFSALAVRDSADARHHMEHFMTMASGMEKVKGEEVIKLMDMGDMHEAGHALEQMMGMMPHEE